MLIFCLYFNMFCVMISRCKIRNKKRGLTCYFSCKWTKTLFFHLFSFTFLRAKYSQRFWYVVTSLHLPFQLGNRKCKHQRNSDSDVDSVATRKFALFCVIDVRPKMARKLHSVFKRLR